MAELIEKSKLLWTPQNKFSVMLLNQGNNFPDILDVADQDTFMAALMDITLPDLADQPLEDYIAGNWVYTRGRMENYLIQLKFRDFNSMTLHSFFSKAFVDMSNEYPDDQVFDLMISTGSGWGEGYDPNSKVISYFKRCILIGVSGVTLDQSAKDSIVEFSITLKTGYLDGDLL